MAKPKPNSSIHKVVTSNRRAFAKYEILETLEAGMVLTGPEVKSLRQGGANLQDGYVLINGEKDAKLLNVHIAPYTQGSTHVTQEPTRTRILLLKKQELKKWMGRTTLKGLTIVPLEIYFSKKGIAKIKIGLAKSKLAPDRRQELRRRTVERELSREYAGKKRIK